MFPVEGNENPFASWLSNNWKTKPVANLVHKKKHVFQQIAQMYFGFIQMNFLSSGTLTSIIVCKKKAGSGNLEYDECRVDQRHGPYSGVPAVLSLSL